MRNKLILIFLLFSLPNQYIFSQSEKSYINNVLIRPNVNIGFLDKEFAHSFGTRVLFPAGGNKVSGIEFSYFNVAKSDNDFFTIGIVLEEKKFNWLNMSIGTIGYFNYGIDSKNLVALTTNIGWEPNTKKRVSPFVTYRRDSIFDEKITYLNTLNFGVNINL